jgi:hypothetical protein
MSAVTQWFGIDNDGQPVNVGWYDVRYSWELCESGVCKWRRWWDGRYWCETPNGAQTQFGNRNTNGEFYRGLAVKPKKGGAK